MPTSQLDARFCEVMDAAPVMIWVSGTDKGCVWFNRPWLTFTGRSLAQEMGNGWSAGVHRDDFERCIEVYTSHFDARKDFRMSTGFADTMAHVVGSMIPEVLESPVMASSLATLAPALTSKNNERCSLSCAAICWKMLN